MNNKNNLLLKTLCKFYESKKHQLLLYRFVKNKHDVFSLRIIDYACTNYTKSHKILFTPKDHSIPIDYYSDYKNQLKSYSKLLFDPFKRHSRIEFLCNDEIIITTIGQLNFFKWFIETKFYQWLEQNIKLVEASMKSKQLRYKT